MGLGCDGVMFQKPWKCPVVKDCSVKLSKGRFTQNVLKVLHLQCVFWWRFSIRVLENRTRVGDVSDTQWQPQHSRVCKNETF